MSNTVSLSLKDGMHLEAHTPDFAQPIPLDADESVGGQGLGHRPMKMLLVGLIGCMTMDAISILRKKRQDFTDFTAEVVEAAQNEDHPHYYTTIRLHFVATGPKISEDALARALELSYTKYCPANAMLKRMAEISYTYEAVQAEA